MKQRETLKQLAEQQRSIILPQTNPNFDSFESRLRRVLDANLGLSVARTLEYDSYELKFYLTIKTGGVLGGCWAKNLDVADHQTGMTLQRTLEIDPQKDIAPQVKAAVQAQKDLEDRHGLLRSLLDLHLEKP